VLRLRSLRPVFLSCLMRPFVLTRCLALIAPLLSAAALAQPNLVANGDFEARYQAPRGTNNVGLVTGSTPTTDLQDWYRTPTATSTTPITNYPDYVATDGVPTANPATYFSANYPALNINYSFAPHGGQSCVVLYQHNVSGDHRYNSIITRQLSSALIPGRAYQVEYWVRRLASDRYRTELALYLTNSAPTFDGGYQYATPSASTFSPSPGNKVLLSGDIRDTQNWTRVSGTITPTDQGNQWITIGYAATNQQYDSSIPWYNAPGIYYAIDDVSISEVPCTPIPTPDINLAAWGQPSSGSAYEYDVRVNNVGATSYTLFAELSGSNGSWMPYTTITYNAYTGPDNPSSNEVQGFTTFHMRLIGPTPPPSGGGSTGPGHTYRFTVTAPGPCNTSVAQNIITIPPYAGGYSESSRTTPSSQIVAYPNPATEIVTISGDVKDAILVNAKGKTLRKADEFGRLDVQSLPDGLYNLQMMQHGKLINQRIQVKH